MQLLAAIIVLSLGTVSGQDPKPNTKNKDTNARFPWDNQNYDRSDKDKANRPLTDQKTFYLDSPADCSRTTFTIGPSQSVNVKGRGSVQTGPSVFRCTLTIEIDSARENRRFHIGVRSVNIRDCDVQLNIYDGRSGETPLESYQCKQQSGSTQKESVIYTSGNIVTFELKRKSRESSNYDIDLDLTPIREGTKIKCNEGINCNPDGPPGHWKFEQKYIVLIVGLCYVLITAVMATIVIVCCVIHAKSGGVWEQRRFGYNNPALNNSGGTTASGKQVTGSSDVWVTAKPYGKEQIPPQQQYMMTKRVPVVTKRMVGGNEDADSVFESDAELMSDPRQQRSLPRTSTHKTVPRYRPDEEPDERYEDNERPQRVSNVEREIAIPVKKHRKYEETHRRKRESSSDNSYTESEESSDDEDIEDDRHESGDETQHTDVDDELRGDGENSGERKGRGKEVKVEYAQKQEKGKEDDGQDGLPSYEESSRYPLYDMRYMPKEAQTGNDPRLGPRGKERENQPAFGANDPRYPQNSDERRDPHGRPNDERMNPTSRGPGDIRPIQQGYPAANRYPAYDHSPASTRRDPARNRPYYPRQYSPANSRRPYGQPERPDRYRAPNSSAMPSYSHVVHRGYTDASPASSAAESHNSREVRLDDSVDYSATIDSGVELMRRTTEV